MESIPMASPAKNRPAYNHGPNERQLSERNRAGQAGDRRSVNSRASSHVRWQQFVESHPTRAKKRALERD
jgi:hypothetical protein